MTLEEIVGGFLKEKRADKFSPGIAEGILNPKLRAILKGKRKIKADELIEFCEYYGLDSTFFNHHMKYQFV